MEKPKENSARHITEVALRLFSQNGFDKTSIRQIAKEAGVSLGLMYNYFGSKEELLKNILKESQKDVQLSFLALKTGESAKKRFKNYINKVFEVVNENPEFWRLHHSIRYEEPLMQMLGGKIEQAMEEVIIELAAVLKELGFKNPETEAALLYAMIDGVVGHYLIDPNYPVENVKNLMVRKYTQKQQI